MSDLDRWRETINGTEYEFIYMQESDLTHSVTAWRIGEGSESRFLFGQVERSRKACEQIARAEVERLSLIDIVAHLRAGLNANGTLVLDKQAMRGLRCLLQWEGLPS